MFILTVVRLACVDEIFTGPLVFMQPTGRTPGAVFVVRRWIRVNLIIK